MMGSDGTFGLSLLPQGLKLVQLLITLIISNLLLYSNSLFTAILGFRVDIVFAFDHTWKWAMLFIVRKKIESIGMFSSRELSKYLYLE